MKSLYRRALAGVGALSLTMTLLSGCAHVQPRAFTFAQLCDPQIGFGGYAEDLARFEKAVARVNQSGAEFAVICGDLVQEPDEKSFADFNRVRAKLRVPAYCAPGNHDIGNVPTAASLKRFRELVGPDYFYFDHGGCRFVVVNTQLWKTNTTEETAKQDAWLGRTLRQAAKRERPVFVVQHYPPFVKTPDEPEEYFNVPLERRRRLLDEMQRAGVVAVLAGHTHRVSTNRAGSIQVVTGETTSKSFDGRPFGFRLWHVAPDGSFRHEFVPLGEE